MTDQYVWKTSSGTYLLPLETKLQDDERTIIINGKVNHDTMILFAESLKYLQIKNPFLPVKVWIDSTGGGKEEGMIIIDMIESCNMPIYTYCMSAVHGIAAMIFISGNKRYMLPSSKIMLEANHDYKDILARHTDLSKEIVKNTFYTSKQAMEYKLCDEIISFDDM